MIILTFFVVLAPVLPINFVLILNGLVVGLSALKSRIALLLSKVNLYKNGIKFRTFLNNYHYILLNYTLTLQHQYQEHHLLSYAFSKWSTIFKYYLFIGTIIWLTLSCSVRNC